MKSFIGNRIGLAVATVLAAACAPDLPTEATPGGLAAARDGAGSPTNTSVDARGNRPSVPSFVGQDLGMLPGDNQSSGFGVNNAGLVVGHSANGSGVVRAFYWDGSLHQLTTAGSRGAAYAISSGATAYAVGYEQAPGQERRAAVWTLPSAVPTFLESGASSASGVNDAGTVVGTYCFSGCGGPDQIFHGAIWVLGGSSRTDIEPLPGYTFAYASDINNNGIVVGGSYGPGPADQRGYLRMADGALIALPPLSNFVQSAALAVSDVDGGRVHVAGYSRDEIGATRAVRWTVNSSTGQIAATIALDQRWAEGVNFAGDVAGTGGSSSTPAATLWRNDVYIALKAPKGGSGSASRSLARGAGSPTYVSGETRMKNWPRALRWVIQ